MNQFCNLGFIAWNGGLRVHRSLLTVVLHDQFPLLSEEFPHGSVPLSASSMFSNLSNFEQTALPFPPIIGIRYFVSGPTSVVS